MSLGFFRSVSSWFGGLACYLTEKSRCTKRRTRNQETERNSSSISVVVVEGEKEKQPTIDHHQAGNSRHMNDDDAKKQNRTRKERLLRSILYNIEKKRKESIHLV